MLFEYTARTADGLVNGTEEASSCDALARLLVGRGLAVVSVTPKRQIWARAAALWKRANEIGTVSLAQKIPFFRQLSALVAAGIPLKESLTAVTENCSYRPLAARAEKIRARVEAGTPLDRAVAESRLLSDAECAAIAVGEATGQLGQVLKHVTDLCDSRHRLRSKIVSATVYPSIVMLFSFAVLAVLFCFVLPRFRQTFSQMGMALPAATERVFRIISVLPKALPWSLAVFIVLIVLFLFLRCWGPTKLYAGYFEMHLPFYGKILRYSEASNSLMLLGLMLRCNVSLLHALQLCANAAHSPVTADAFRRLCDAAQRGDSIGTEAASLWLFRGVASSMIRTGERGDTLIAMLENASQCYADELEIHVSRLSSKLEPLLMIVIGAVVLLTAYAIYIPIIDFANTLAR